MTDARRPRFKAKTAPTSVILKRRFEKGAKLILDEWGSPEASGGDELVPPYIAESADDRLRRCTYALVRQLKRGGRETALSAALLGMIENSPSKQHLGGAKIDGKPFKLALRLLSIMAEVPVESGPLSPRRRHEVSERMELADFHDVEPRYLESFNKRIGNRQRVGAALDEAKPERKANRTPRVSRSPVNKGIQPSTQGPVAKRGTIEDLWWDEFDDGPLASKKPFSVPASRSKQPKSQVRRRRAGKPSGRGSRSK